MRVSDPRWVRGGEGEARRSLMLCVAGEELRCNASAACTSFMSEDKRYFVSDTDDIWNLEASVLESPRDTQLWIKLAFRYLSQSDT